MDITHLPSLVYATYNAMQRVERNHDATEPKNTSRQTERTGKHLLLTNLHLTGYYVSDDARTNTVSNLNWLYTTRDDNVRDKLSERFNCCIIMEICIT